MNLMRLYNNIENPLNSDETIKHLLYYYANTNVSKAMMQVWINFKERNMYKDENYFKEKDYFYSKMFNKWKNSVLNLSRNNLTKSQTSILGEDFFVMQNFLKNVPDLKTEAEVSQIINGEYNNKILSNALKKYMWNSNASVSWTFVISGTVNNSYEYFNVEHRLYLNTDLNDTYKMVNLLVDKYDKYHLPYNFKFSQSPTRKDSIVMYMPTEYLSENVKILKEIKSEYPDLVSRVKESSIILGKIDNWIGYGSEPCKVPEDAAHSYNSSKSSIIYDAIDQQMKQWIMNNKDNYKTFNGKNLTVQDYLALICRDYLVEKLKKKYDNSLSCENGISLNSLALEFGYTLNDLNSPDVKEYMFQVIKRDFPEHLLAICKNSNKTISTSFTDHIKVNLRNGKQIKLYDSEIYGVIKSICTQIPHFDSYFINNVRNKINEESIKYGIDINKFCFDVDKVEKMKEFDSANVTMETITETISPELIKNRMKLPNGINISAEQYIHEFVFRHLPKDGAVILKNNKVVSVKNFIEQGVMGECQREYNGDIVRYLSEKTKANTGVVQIGDRKIQPHQIVDYINPDLLKKRVKLPNGCEISACQYIQEIYSPYIPETGIVTLSNGINVPVTHYVEETLFDIGQSKYNGDISQIIYNTTRSNNGIINCNAKHFNDISLKKMFDESNKTKDSIEVLNIRK